MTMVMKMAEVEGMTRGYYDTLLYAIYCNNCKFIRQECNLEKEKMYRTLNFFRSEFFFNFSKFEICSANSTPNLKNTTNKHTFILATNKQTF